MSQALLLRINALEGRMAALEQRLKVLEPPAAGDEAVPYPVVHIGHGKYAVTTFDGTRVSDQPLSREEADGMAAELTEHLALKLG